jgi:hypothetical protein
MADDHAATEPDNILSTPAEIQNAVERNAIDRGRLFIGIIVELQIDHLLEQIEELANEINPRAFREDAARLNVNPAALDRLDEAGIGYPTYFAHPDLLREHPRLIFYYRNIAMISDKAMRGVGLNTASAEEIAAYLNRVIGDLILEVGVTGHRHVEMLMANLGDALGGSSRNEVGRVAMARVMRMLIEHLAARGRIESITYTLRESMVPGTERTSEEAQVFTPDLDVNGFLRRLENHYVKYHEARLTNGVTLLIDKQVRWFDAEGEPYNPSADMISDADQSGAETDMLWGAEVKGGADPAGSDEHWKTARSALRRVLDDAGKSGHARPPLSFIGTTIVGKVASEIRNWLDEGDLITAYNLTKLIEQPEERQRFLRDMMGFLGYGEGP